MDGSSSSSWNSDDIESDNTTFSADSFQFDPLDSLSAFPSRPRHDRNAEPQLIHSARSDGREVRANNFMDQQSSEWRASGRSELHNRVLFIVAIHMMMMCLSEVLTIAATFYSNKMNLPETTVYQIQLGVVLAMPCAVILIHNFLNHFKTTCSCWTLLTFYSVGIAIFLCSASDLISGQRSIYAYIAVVSMSLSISLALYSRYSLNSKCDKLDYALLVIITSVVSTALNLSLIYADLSAILPPFFNSEESTFDEFVYERSDLLRRHHLTSMWLVMTTLILSALIVHLSKALVSTKAEVHAPSMMSPRDSPPTILAFRTMVIVEMFFVAIPMAIIGKLKSICDGA